MFQWPDASGNAFINIFTDRHRVGAGISSSLSLHRLMYQLMYQHGLGSTFRHNGKSSRR